MSFRPFYDKVIRLLEEEGDKTALQIALAMHADMANVYKIITTARRERRMHIASWVKQRSVSAKVKSFVTVQVYGFGPGEDAPKPAPARKPYKRVTKPLTALDPAAARRELDAEIAQGVMTATRAVLARDPDNFFASMLGQMGAA